MVAPACSEETFIGLFESLGATETARRLNISVRNVFARRITIENRTGRKLIPPGAQDSQNYRDPLYPSRLPLTIDSGLILIGSDAHYWTDEVTTAHKAFVKLIGDLKPKIVVLNGDVVDGARISRHAPLGWERRPTLVGELKACEERLVEIEETAPNAERIWTIGNHDQRFENRLASQAPEFEGVPGFTLKEHFPYWKHALSSWVNDDTVIKHRFKGGIHATHNNTLWSGRSIVTGHLHSLKVTPFDDYDGTRWGVDTGTLADTYGPQFGYTEDNPVNWRSGFVVLTYHKGKLLWPEIAYVIDKEHCSFRGTLFKI